MSASIAAAFHAADVRGRLHAQDLDSGAETGLDPDALVVQASVFKIPILVELCRQAQEGRLALTDRVRIPAGARTLGGLGLSVMCDEAELSVRDVAYLMMAISDNHATDVLVDLVGLGAVNATMREHGFPRTQLTGDCAHLFRTMEEDLGGPWYEVVADGDADAAVRAMRAVTPEHTTHTTPRETTDLLAALWRDERFHPDVCAEVRRILGLQVWPHRLAAGFPGDRIRISGKTGTIAHLRSEAAVVERPDGRRTAIAVFVDAPRIDLRNPTADRVIGDAAAVAEAELAGPAERRES